MEELVTWLNEMDTTYRTGLREMNELNFARFDGKVEQRLAETKAELIKWMFVFWVGTVTTLGGLMFALFHFFRS